MKAQMKPHDRDGCLSPYSARVAQYGHGWYRVWAVLAACFAIPGTFWLLRQGIKPMDRPQVTIVEGQPSDVIVDIGRATQAIVYLDAHWSSYAVIGRKSFKDAAVRLTFELPNTRFFVLDEWPIDEGKAREVVQTWLSSLELRELEVGHGFGLGWGSLLWLEKGRVVHEEVSAMKLQPAGIVERTQKLWGSK